MRLFGPLALHAFLKASCPCVSYATAADIVEGIDGALGAIEMAAAVPVR